MPERIVESTKRVNVWQLLHAGGLAEGACTTLQIDHGAGLEGCLRLTCEGGDLVIEGGPRVAVIWQEWLPGCCRPWFSCPKCTRPCGDLFLCDEIACRLCLKLKYRRPYGDRLYRMRRRLLVARHNRRAIAAEIRLLELQMIRGTDGKRTDRG
ncbi:hypothetical protein [Bradyrhizobium sp. CCGUVB23]|uniref:hypothetical protein n=1 Tax=Bradyrhizobium sp. CCGUVB23 TaxID=2949630 RepID=UPI0020B3418C|nr:hypothetical protein [Bradyrhizobium sp. CCGUVB23]MCP3462537.1 hypothetical protein [Bradyrhizobium sp. CCGUVB23]